MGFKPGADSTLRHKQAFVDAVSDTKSISIPERSYLLNPALLLGVKDFTPNIIKLQMPRYETKVDNSEIYIVAHPPHSSHVSRFHEVYILFQTTQNRIIL